MVRCQATTTKGSQCKNQAAPGSDYCRRHAGSGTGDDVYQGQARQWLKVLRVAQWAVTVLGAVFAIGAAYGVASMLGELRTARESSNWPTATGRVVSSEADSWRQRDSGHDRTVYLAAIRYHYKVDGERYEGVRIAFGGRASSTGIEKTIDKGAAEAVVERYARRKAVKVFYNPWDPGESVLEPGTAHFRYGTLVGFTVFFFVAIGVAFGARPFFQRQMRSSAASMAEQLGPNIWETAAEYDIYPPNETRPAAAQPALTGSKRTDVIPNAASLPNGDRTARIKNALGMWAVLTGVLAFLAVFVVHLGIKLSNWIFELKTSFWPLYGYVALAIAGAVTAFVVYAWWREEHDVEPTEEEGERPAVTPIEREHEIRRRIDEMGEGAFPDQPPVTWTIKGFEHREDYSFVEVEPSRETGGWSRLKFAVYFRPGRREPELAGGYAFSDGLWTEAFEMAGHDLSELDRLLFQGTGEPMPTEEREEWIERHIQAIGKQGWPEDEVTWTLRSMEHKDAYSFVEADASPADAIGWSRLKFVLLMQSGGQPIVAGCYGLDETGWGLVFENDTNTPSDWKQLHVDDDT